jgi:hypothetical protein
MRAFIIRVFFFVSFKNCLKKESNLFEKHSTKICLEKTLDFYIQKISRKIIVEDATF